LASSVVGDTGTAWFKNAMVEKAASIGNYIKSGLVSTIGGRFKSTSRNLINIDGNINYAIWASTTSNIKIPNGVRNTANLSYRHTKGILIQLKPSTAYTISSNCTIGGNATSAYIAVYSALTKDVLGSLVVNTSTIKVTFTTPIDGLVFIEFARLGGGDDTLGWVDYTNIMLNEGSSALPFVQYIDAVSYAPADWVGRGLPNNITDMLSILKGSSTKNIGNVILNGSESWIMTTASTTNYQTFYRNPASDFKTGGDNTRVCTDLFPTVTASLWTNPTLEGVNAGGSDNMVYISILKSKLSTVDVAGFKTWLASNPVLLLYQLDAPIPNYFPIGAPIAYPNGTIIYEPYIKDEGSILSGKINLTRAAKFIEWVNKININTQTFTPVDISKVTLATDGKSFTITGGLEEEWYEYGAYPMDGDSTLGTVTATAQTTIGGVVNETVKTTARLTQETEDIRTENSLISKRLKDMELLYFMGV
jgi:hypothetical protein